MKQLDRSSERVSSSLKFCDENLFFIFLSSPPNLRAKSIPKKDNIGFGEKCSSDCSDISKAFGLGCVSVLPKIFCPPPETHYSGSGPVTVLFYLQCTNCTVVCDQRAIKSSLFVLLHASILRKYHGKPSLRFASF